MDSNHKITYEDFRRYQNGEMTAPEQHFMEKQMLEDQLLADAFEGFKMMTADGLAYDDSLNSLNEQLAKRIERVAKRQIPVWSYAAAASALLAVGFAVYYFNQRQASSDQVSTVISAAPAKKEAAELTQPLPDTKAPQQGTPSQQTKSKKNETGGITAKREKNTGPKTKYSELIAANEAAKPGLQLRPDQAVSTPQTVIPESLPKSVPYAFKAAPETSRSNAAFSRNKVTAYTNVVSGRVIDQNGQALSGISIFLPKKPGITTDQNGNFSISAPLPDSLKFGGIGYKNKWVAVNQPDLGSIKLEEDTQALNEVVVVGYGTAKKQSLSATSVNVISAKPAAGWQKYNDYLLENTRKFSFVDSVKVSFTVNINGSLTDFKSDISGEKGEAAIRIIKEGPAWTPALQQNVKVAEAVSVTVKFRD